MTDTDRGIWPAVLTPWDDDRDQPNLDALTQLIDLFVEQKLGGLYLLGSTGQGAAISMEDRKTITEHAAKITANRMPLIVHVGAIATRDACELARHAAGCGVDGLSSVPPIYFAADTDITFNHYREISEAGGIPFYPYHLASLASAACSPDEFAKRLLELPNAAGLKYTSHDLFGLTRIRQLTEGKLTIFSGPDELMIHCITCGSDGAIGTFYNLFGPTYTQARQRFLAGDVAAGRKLMTAFNSMCHDVLTPRTKVLPFVCAAMRLKYGIDIGGGRTPGHHVDFPWTDSEVQELIDRVDNCLA